MSEHAPAAAGLQQCAALHDLCSLLAVMIDFKTLDTAAAGLADATLAADATALLSELAHVGREQGEQLAQVEGDEGSLTVLDAAVEFARTEGSLVAVRREHTRLFENPEHPELPFYEGAFINRNFKDAGREAPDHDLLFVNQAALDAERQYRRAGLERDLAAGNIPADCIVTELQFLQHLFKQKAEALCHDDLGALVQVEAALVEFLRLHAKSWMGAFFDRLAGEAHTAYFSLVGVLGVMLVDALQAAFPEAFARHPGRGRS